MGDEKKDGIIQDLVVRAGAAGTGAVILDGARPLAAEALGAAGSAGAIALTTTAIAIALTSMWSRLAGQVRDNFEHFVTCLAQELGQNETNQTDQEVRERIDGWIASHEGADAQVSEAVRKLLDTVDPAAVAPLARLVARAHAHGQKGATATFKAIARLLGQLSGDEIADLRKVVHVVQARASDDRCEIQAMRPRNGPWTARGGGRVAELKCDAEMLFQAMRSASAALEPGEANVATSLSWRTSRIALSASVRALLADVLGPEPAEVSDASP